MPRGEIRVRNENCGDDLEFLPAGIKTAGDARKARESRTNEKANEGEIEKSRREP